VEGTINTRESAGWFGMKKMMAETSMPMVRAFGMYTYKQRENT